jgi:hypothetical protein
MELAPGRALDQNDYTKALLGSYGYKGDLRNQDGVGRQWIDIREGAQLELGDTLVVPGHEAMAWK